MLATALHLAVALSPESTVAVPEAPVTVGSVEAAEVVAVEAPEPEPVFADLDAPAIEPGSITLPRRRGIGLLVSAGVLATAGLPLKIIATRSDLRVAGEFDRGTLEATVCIESCYVGPFFNVLSAPMLFSSAALMGGGLNVYGRWAAHRDLRDGRLRRPLRTGLMTGLGLGLIGAGMATFIGSRFGLRDQSSAVGYVAVRELGWWGALAGVYTGAGLAGFGMGYRAGRRDADAQANARIAPVISASFVGLGLSGSF